MSPAAELTPQDISTGQQWMPVELSGDLMESTCRSVLGETGDEPPLGVLVPIARRAFARNRPLPPGGVLLGIDVAAVASPPPHLGLEYRASTSERRDSRGRLVLSVAVHLRAPEVGTLGTVGFTLRWPTEGAS